MITPKDISPKIDINKTSFNILDLETTGLNSNKDKIIEITVVKWQNGKILDQYYSLINPGESHIKLVYKFEPFLNEDFSLAARFEEIKDNIRKFLGNDIIIAHNAIFDYSFLYKTFKEHNIELVLPYCCTVKLSRKLYKEHKKHNLDSVIERLNIKTTNRHRSYFDTQVLVEFLNNILRQYDTKTINDAFNKIKKTSKSSHSTTKPGFGVAK